MRRVDPVKGEWRIDLHTHTSASPDSKTEPRALVERAREVGLARFAVTDHNTIDGALAAHALAPDFVIVGEEIETATGGELIAYFLTEVVPAGLSLDETLRRLRDQGAVISVSHPLDRLRGSAMGLEHTLAIIDRIDALEGFNARCLLPSDNRRAQALAMRHGLAQTGGSDGHIPLEIGRGYVTLPPFKLEPGSFLTSLKRGRAGGKLSGLLPHFASTWAKVRK